MAINLNIPKETIQIEGKDKVTNLFEVNSFEPTNKLESTVNIIDTDGYVSVYANSISPIRRIYIQAPVYNFNIELPYVNKVKISRYEAVGATGVVESEMAVEGVNILKFPEEFGSLITNVEVATTCSASTKEIKVGIYAWKDQI